MQLREVVTPSEADTPQDSACLPWQTQNGHAFMIEYRNTNCNKAAAAGKLDLHSNTRVLRHRCMLKNCAHNRDSTLCSSRLEYPGEDSDIRARCSKQTLHETDVYASHPTPLIPAAAQRSPIWLPPVCLHDHVTLCTRGTSTSMPPQQPSRHQQHTPQQVHHPLIPLYYRKKAVRYILKQLHVGGSRDIHQVYKIQQHIISLEEQIFYAAKSREEYVTKLASKLAAILQQLDRCRASTSAVPSSRVHPSACF
ncbi:hypothetical protein OTU49_015160 [Cherax quadricarinatus]|uniref:Mediator complex subunit 15 KIX domain-containing protein n=1 Tax=Cherax quadricarinatus TaxID=27406 RepID=A0AAW0XZY1_CHEQU